MKQIFALLLILMMLFSLSACGGKDDTLPAEGNDPQSNTQQQEPAATPDPGEENSSGDGEYSSFDAPLLDLLGLTDIAPDGVSKKEVKHDWKDLLQGEYSFYAPVNGDAAAERMEYANKVLAAIQTISDDQNAYEDVFTGDFQGWRIAQPHTEGIVTETGGMPGYYFYKDGKVISLSIFEEGDAAEHCYTIYIQKEADDYIQYEGN